MSGFRVDWTRVITAVYSPPNELKVGHVPELDEWLAAARFAFEAEPPRPVLLPVKVNNRTGYYAIAPDADQSRLLRKQLVAAVGTPWSTFNGASLAELSDAGPLDDAVRSSVGASAELIYRFEVPQASRGAVRSALRRLMEHLASSPNRSVHLLAPIGRLVGDFEEACASQRRRAAELALQQLANDHRLTARNQLFLEVQFLAAFEEWERLDTLVAITELLRLRRPALVSDALSLLALNSLKRPVLLEEFTPIATRFGALVASTGEIRSQTGADYYCLWAAVCGEEKNEIADRVRQSGWSPSILDVADFPTEATPSQFVLPTDVVAAVKRALEQGRYDAAVQILSAAETMAEMFGLILDLVIAAPSPGAIKLLNRYRSALGLPAGHTVSEIERDPAEQGVTAVLHILSDPNTEPAEIERLRTWLRNHGPAAVGLPGALSEVSLSLNHLLHNGPVATLDLLIDSSLDLAISMRQARFEGPEFAEFGLTVLELWAFSSGFENRQRMERVIDLTNDVLARGISAERFDDVVEFLCTCWDPFLTDTDCAIGIDVIESLMNFSPRGVDPVRQFALPILSRIGQHNAHRISQNDIDVARSLALEFDLDLGELSTPVTNENPIREESRTVLIYSLFSNSSTRAAQVLTTRYPGLKIESNDDHVSSDRLRSQVQRSDLVVITDRAAKHAATEAIKAQLNGRQLGYALGRGSSSIIDAVETLLRQQGLSEAA